MHREPKNKEYSTSLRICNARAFPVTLYLEPWGEQYTLAPEATFTAVARGPAGDTLEVEVADDHMTLYGWPGAVVTLFPEGQEVDSSASGRAPVLSTPYRP